MKILLLHGAGLGRWIWDGVVPELAHPADALDLPGRAPGENPDEVTLQASVDVVRARIAQHGSRCVLVGHSFSSAVALACAAASSESIAAVILVGGVFPESGKPFTSIFPLPQRLILTLLLKSARRGIKLPQSAVKREYCNDLDPETTQRVLARIVPEAPRLYLDRVDWSSLPSNVPRYFVKLTNDQSVSSEKQDQMIGRAGASSVETLHTGHLPMLADPRGLAAAINRFVSSVE